MQLRRETKKQGVVREARRRGDDDVDVDVDDLGGTEEENASSAAAWLRGVDHATGFARIYWSNRIRPLLLGFKRRCSYHEDDVVPPLRFAYWYNPATEESRWCDDELHETGGHDTEDEPHHHGKAPRETGGQHTEEEDEPLTHGKAKVRPRERAVRRVRRCIYSILTVYIDRIYRPSLHDDDRESPP